MIDLSPVLPPPTSPAVTTPVASATGAQPGGFEKTLGAFLDARGAKSDPASGVTAKGDRQASAEDGKDLPATPDADEDAADALTAPVWFPASLLPATPLPPVTDAAAALLAATAPAIAATPDAPVAAPTPATDVAVTNTAATDATIATPATPEADAALAALMTTVPAGTTAIAPMSIPTIAAATPDAVQPAPRAASPRATLLAGTAPQIVAATDRPLAPLPFGMVAPTAGQATALQAATAPAVAAAVAAAANAATRATQTAQDDPTAPRTTASDATPAALAQATTAAPAITVSTTPQPAGQVFAAAIAAASSWRDRAQDDAQDPTGGSTAMTIATPLQLDLHAVAATGDAGGTALDLTQDSGLQRMIDRIETLRDDADAGDTRIRLVPDALGSVAVSVRQDGDRVHVHFSAEHDSTRALIADAQPRLTELAAQRGVKIGDTSVATDSGSGAASQQRPPNHTPNPAAQIARAPASATTPTDTEALDDARVA